MAVEVTRIVAIGPHPNADRLDIIELANGMAVVVGQHYFVDTLGLYIHKGSWLPGYLAKDLWLTGKNNPSDEWVEVKPRDMRGIMSEGLFCGSVFQRDRKSPTEAWGYWQDHWKEGDDAAPYLGIRNG